MLQDATHLRRVNRSTVVYSVGGGHLCTCDARLAKQQPVLNLPIVQGLQRGERAVEKKTRTAIEAKFNTAYLIAKEELPFSKYQAILSLQENGLDINMTYPTITDTITATVISEVMTEQLDSEINQQNYISIMTNSENGRKQDTKCPGLHAAAKFAIFCACKKSQKSQGGRFFAFTCHFLQLLVLQMI